MNYNFEKPLKILELDKILQLLSNEAYLSDAKEQAVAIRPETDISAVDFNLRQTADAHFLLARYPAPSFGNLYNVSSDLKRAEASAVLSMKELLNIADVLRVVRLLKDWRDNLNGTDETSLDGVFSLLLPNKYLEEKITFAIASEEQMSDNASPKLYDIRRKIIAKSGKIRDILDRITRGPASKYLQESIVTQRDGRYVVPLKAENKGQISGIVHDISSTGSTLFIEPMSVVETNNEIRVLRLEEQEEIYRILSELSAEAGNFADSIIASYNAVVRLDLIFAKAKFAYKLKAVKPDINGDGKIVLKNARHPLIPQKSVVPISFEIGKNYNTMVITGPNTGGKTVTLKTVGLLTLMTMCGLMIPADEGSSVAVFSKIFADIGDEQSIEQSLSTFSSHMVNIISILDSADDDSLVLFDELCAGTDPVEGTALAKVILMRLSAYGSKVVATTHYPELKSYAIDTKGVEIASCEFDVATLKPTYRLITGVPGRSNAFAISQRLGLGADIINEVKKQVSDEDLRFDRVVEALEKARHDAEEEQKQSKELRLELEKTKAEIKRLETEMLEKQKSIMEKTRQTANDIIEKARYKSALLLNELEEMKKSLNAENSASMIERARAEYKSALKDLEETADPIEITVVSGEKITNIKKGDSVLIADINRQAVVLDVNEDKKQAYVISGAIKMWVDFENLRKSKKSENKSAAKKARTVTGTTGAVNREISGEVDLRGMASDEAILELDRYIDNAIVSGLNTIRVIHGKGTGVLRKSVQAHLRSHRSVRTFRLGTFGEGENGVTIVELK